MLGSCQCTGPSDSLKDLTIEKFYEFYRAWCDWEKQPDPPKREVVGKRLGQFSQGSRRKELLGKKIHEAGDVYVSVS